jgi:hypothetical protein
MIAVIADGNFIIFAGRQILKALMVFRNNKVVAFGRLHQLFIFYQTMCIVATHCILLSIQNTPVIAGRRSSAQQTTFY